MKQNALRLSVKGLLMVLLLLSIELAFVGCHFWLLQEAERESRQQQNSRQIIARATDLLQSLYLAGDNVAKYAFNRDLDRLANYNKAKYEIPRQLQWMKEHLRENKSQSALLEKIDANVMTGLNMLDEMRRVSDTEIQVVTARHAIKMRARMQKHMENLVQDLIEFLNTEKKIESASPAYIKMQRTRTAWLLGGGVTLNILAAVLLALAYVRGITSRLDVVVENSQRLKQRKPLRAPMIGSDEIAQLDRAFHEMSHSLREQEALVISSEDQIRTIIAQMPIGLMITDADEKIEYANPVLEKMLVTAQGELVGKPVQSYFNDLDLADSLLNQARSVEVMATTNSGNSVPVEFTVTEVALGKQSRRLATVLDISERHEIEKMKEAFVAMVSHDLRTPLTSVAGFLQMLPMGVYGAVEPAASNEAEAAEKQVDQLITLINDLLDLEKLKAGQLEMFTDEIGLEDVIDTAVDSVYKLAEENKITILFEGCEATIKADQERLEQAIGKTLAALIRMSSPGTEITVDVVLNAASNHELLLTMTAPSVSLSPVEMENLFEPFQTSQSLGLGLPLARAIIMASGGSCGAKTLDRGISNDSGGTQLWTKLPRII
jgi:PAS domain S-box-containing protein